MRILKLSLYIVISTPFMDLFPADRNQQPLTLLWLAAKQDQYDAETREAQEKYYHERQIVNTRKRRCNGR